MNNWLRVIYTLLLSVLVLTSCGSFLLLLSEALQPRAVLAEVDLSGLHNVSKTKTFSENEVPVLEHSETQENEIVSETPVPDDSSEMTFAETLSLNAVTTDGLPDTGQPPILISLGDNAKLDLKNPDELLFVNDSEQHNDTKTFAVVDSNDTEEKDDKEIKETLVVKAIPMHEIKLTEDAFQTTTPLRTETENESQEEVKEENIPVQPATPAEDIPSFSEWAQKQLAEAEKKDTVLNHSSQPSHTNTNFSSKSTKRSKNYASPACGAKIVAVNPEAGSASSILSPNRDEYMLNSCNSRIWFVVELCEAVQAQKIEIANFELFSSIPKDFAVYFSDRFPTRDWTSVGQFTAKEMRDVQSFDLFPHIFGKFIKVELLSHHGSEHYCPISLFKVYGTSEFEVLEKESSQHATAIDDDEDDDIIDIPDVVAAEAEPSKNLFGSARDAVMSIMKKAAQALVKTEVPSRNMSSEHNDTSTDKIYKKCCSPSHIIVCDNCSETLYNEVYELISCSSDKLTNLVRQVFLKDTLKCTGICQPYGFDFKSTKVIEFANERVAYMNALFPPKYLAALCNILAIKEKKVVLNTSFENENVTTNITVDESPEKISSETNTDQEVKLVPDKNNASTDEKIDESAQIVPTDPEQTVEINNTVPVDMPKEKTDTVDVKTEESITSAEDKPSQEQVDDSKIPLETENSADPQAELENKDAPKSEPKNGQVEFSTEKAKENVNVEEAEPIMIDADSFMSDFDQMAVDPTPAGKETVPNQNPTQATMQKESVFLRLSNRVKTLERNMSLSGQYLEELSRRYKKQVEEMQKTFEKTVVQMTEERKKSIEREQKYLEQMTSLQDQLSQMSTVLKILMDERDSWFGSMTFFKFVLFQLIVVAAVFYYVSKRKTPEPLIIPIPKRSKKKLDKLRRRSVEGVSGHATPSAKKRRPSEEALQIARQSAEEHCKDDDEGEWQVARKNRRRKTSIIHRNLEKPTWCRQDSIGRPQENPIPLDEEEFFAPVSEPVEFNGVPERKQEPPKTNGSFFNNLKNRTMKTRRLSSPAFLRTLSRQSTRSNPSPAAPTLEPIFNGNFSKKAASESPTSSLWSESTEISQNGQSEIESVGKNRKKARLKNIFRKVF